MVLIQVEEVDQQFQAIDWLRKNGWNEPKAPQETVCMCFLIGA